ncbi:MAG: hypothetical protein NW224_15890 [Leptolyngbyaceae cyanobacterium bins.302]|nr:hypothetical protein [Leptolyngbyaceae cyanobacterium bins.302]
MNYCLVTSMLMLATIPVVAPMDAIANTSTHSSTRDRAPAAVAPLPSESTQDQPEQTKIPNRSTQSSQQSPSNIQVKPDQDRLNQSYPAYCEFFLFNVEPGSWQFHQDIQRCLYGY